jgi:hypothetical protein
MAEKLSHRKVTWNGWKIISSKSNLKLLKNYLHGIKQQSLTHSQFSFLITCKYKTGRFLKIFFSETALPKWGEIWWEAPMEGSVLSFLKAEWIDQSETRIACGGHVC